MRLDSPGSGVAQARALAGLVKQRRLVASGLKIDFGCDPLSAGLRAGSFEPAHPCGEDVGKLALELRDAGFAGHTFMADGRVIHAGGGSEAQELAYMLASALYYLRLLERHGFSVEAARDQISFLLTADADQFLGIAKFRALRLLWARVEEACGLAPKPIRLHGETAWRMLSRRDPYVNVLRTTMAVFAAGIGGADAITALPFTNALGLPDAFARRIARNSQLIGIDEAHLAIVADPAAGAGGFEALTQGLCEKAWGLFQEMEQAGGILAGIKAGILQVWVAQAARARSKAIATRKMPLTGTSEFPNLDEATVEVLIPAPAQKAEAQASFTPVLPCRDALAFEALRDLADGYKTRVGAPPKVFLANIGPFAAFSTRAGFATNAFAAGGIEAIGNAGFALADGATDIAALTAAALASPAQLVCLCGSEAGYATEAEALVSALQSKFPLVFIASRPLAMATAKVQYLYAGCDLVAALQSAHSSLSGA